MSVGRPRPDLISRCLPRIGAHDQVPYGLSTYEICTSTNKLRLDDGFKVCLPFRDPCLAQLHQDKRGQS